MDAQVEETQEVDHKAKNKVFDHTPEHQRNYPEQKFQVSHLTEDSFKAGDGYRDYVRYRHLGLTPETGNLIEVHVIRPIHPCTSTNRKPHFHDCAFNMAYIIEGWMELEFEGYGVHMMRKGSCWNQSGIKHKVLDFSEDCELMEINLPADFDTVNVKF